MVINEQAIHLKTGETFVSPFLLVYGTLRLGQGNYKRYLQNTFHIGTYELPGWTLRGITSGFTGDPKDCIVVDAFNIGLTPDKIIKPTLELYELNYELDQLEGIYRGGYTVSLIQLDITPTKAPGTFKFYNGHYQKDNKAIRDHVSPDRYLDYPTLKPISWL